MRVLMTADTVGGVFSYATELAGALRPLGVDVALATTGRATTADQRDELRRAGVDAVFESAWKLEWMEDPWEDVARTQEWLLGVADRVRPDAVHLNEYAHAALPFGAPALVVGHSCVSSWFAEVRRGAPPPAFDTYRAVVRRGLSRAALVVAPSQAMLRALLQHHGGFDRARVIPNGRDPGRFRPRTKEPFVLCAARLWDDAKNAAALDAVAPALPWPVLLAGEERHPDSAGAVRSRGAQPVGRLAQDDLAALFGRAAVYALPARYEPFGLSVLEAAHAGCALVLGDISSLRETWDGAALFVAPDDHEGLRHTLLRLCRDAALREELARLARSRAAAFTPARMAEAYAASYAGLSAGSPTREESAPCAS